MQPADQPPNTLTSLSLPPHAELDPAGAQAAWHTANTSDGLTPAAFAALAKQRQAAASTAAVSETAQAAALQALQLGPSSSVAAAAAAPSAAEAAPSAAEAAPSAADASQQADGQLPPSTAPLVVPVLPHTKQAEPSSPSRSKSPNGVAVSEAELSASSISSSSIGSEGSSSSQLAILATGPSGRLGSGTFVLSPTAAALAPAPSLPAALVDGSGEASVLCPSTPEVKPTRLSAELPVGAAPAAEGGCKALLALAAPPAAPALLAVRAGPAALVSAIGSPASSDSRTDDHSSQASQSGRPLRMSESPPLLKPRSPAAAAAKSGKGSPRAAEALERVSSGNAKMQLSCRWGEAAAAAVDCDCRSFGGGWEAPAKGQDGAGGRVGMPSWVDRGERDGSRGSTWRDHTVIEVAPERLCRCVPTGAGHCQPCRCAAPPLIAALPLSCPRCSAGRPRGRLR